MSEIIDVFGEEVAADVDTPLVMIEGTKGDPGADGITPTIGANGNWYLGSTDTGKPSRGATGDPGADGITPTIGANGNWYLGTTDTGKPSRGEKGDPGATGKTAYQYAQEGGYTGTETEFAEKLAQEQLTGTTGTLTPEQVYNAVSVGIPVKVQYKNSLYGDLSFTAFNIADSFNVMVSQTIVYYNDVYILAQLTGNIQSGGWGFTSTALAKKADIPTVPTSLKNPNALTIKIGSTTVTYDGSAAKTVEIADGSEVSY